MTSHVSSLPFDVSAIRAQFPILSRKIGDKELIYFDNAASAQKPQCVIDAMDHSMTHSYANVHRGLHTLANETTTDYESARQAVVDFVNAPSPEHIIFTKGGTEAINLVAYGLASSIKSGDEIILSVMEHHSNIVPWHFLRERYGAVLKWVSINADGSLDMEGLKAALSPRTRLVALTHMSNVLGTIPDVKQVIALAHEAGAEVLLDGCQAGVHVDIDVQDLDVDYYVLTGHKIYGPSGIGALYGRMSCLEALDPWQGGGEMISIVTQDAITYNTPPHKFEAGTPPIVQAIGLGTAMRWLRQYDVADIAAHEAKLYAHAYEKLRGMNGIEVYGNAPGKGGVLAFNLGKIHPHDVAQIVDRYGVAIRAGHHCAQPLMTHLGVSATARASFGIYNTLDEVDRFVEAIRKAYTMLS